MNIERRLLLIATLGAHSNYGAKGFRQKDVAFLLELFTNWMDVLLRPDIPQWHNTQVMRWTEELAKQGRAKVIGTGRRKRYRLTRVGLLEVIYELTEVRGYAEFRHVLLIYYFLKTYRERMLELAQREGSGISKAVQLEIDQIFDADEFLKAQLRELEMQIERLRVRVKDGLAFSAYAAKLKAQGEPLDQVIQKATRAHPYELEGQKPLVEVFREIEPAHQFWELIEGNRQRAEVLWTTQLKLLEGHFSLLKGMVFRPR
jgi:hypothetical protein